MLHAEVDVAWIAELFVIQGRMSSTYTENIHGLSHTMLQHEYIDVKSDRRFLAWYTNLIYNYIKLHSVHLETPPSLTTLTNLRMPFTLCMDKALQDLCVSFHNVRISNVGRQQSDKC